MPSEKERSFEKLKENDRFAVAHPGKGELGRAKSYHVHN